MENEITNVKDLLFSVDHNRVCDRLLKLLGAPQSEEPAARANLLEFFSRMEQMELSQTNDVIVAVPPMLGDSRVVFVPMTDELFKRFCVEDFDLIRPELDKKREMMLRFFPLERVLSMPIIWLVDDSTQVTDDAWEQLAVLILLDITFLGMDVATHQRNIDSITRKAHLLRDNDERMMCAYRVLPWFVDGTPVVNIRKITSQLRNDPHYTVYRLFSEIWGVVNWKPAQYRVILAILAYELTRSHGCLTIHIYMKHLTEMCHCSVDDVKETVRIIEGCFIWSMQNKQPHRTRLICGHTVDDDGWICLQMDKSLTRLYAAVRPHARMITEMLMIGPWDLSMNATLILELSSTYFDLDTHDDLQVQIPIDVMIQNLPIPNESDGVEN